jgi:1-acyl-sn-glycerol-3-phosphate acyltransferase
VRKAYLSARSAILWAVSGIHFAVVCTFLLFLALFIDPRKNDWPQRFFFRNILRLAGARFEVKYATGFDPTRTSIFVSNHVNLFDPFVIYSAIPQFVRGFELESHFKVPIYGWMMKRFGNIPVPDARGKEGLILMRERAKTALDAGISLIAFPEGSRTRTGHMREFEKGIFNLAHKFGVPIVPMSILGSYQFFQTGSWILFPEKITVLIHDPIETKDVAKADVDDLRERVHAIISAPVEESLRENPVPQPVQKV